MSNNSETFNQPEWKGKGEDAEKVDGYWLIAVNLTSYARTSVKLIWII